MPPDFEWVEKMEKDYTIPFKGLGVGKHSFKFEIKEEFFESYDLPDIKKGSVSISLDLIKESTLLDLHFQLNGELELKCDRCLGNYIQPVVGEFRLVVKFGEAYNEESDEVIVIPQTENKIDLSQYIYEYVNLLLPIKKTHLNMEDCDPKMLEKINAHAEQEIDPRWEALKKLKLK